MAVPHAPRQQSYYKTDWQALSHSCFLNHTKNQARLVAPSVPLVDAARPVETKKLREMAKGNRTRHGLKGARAAGKVASVAARERTASSPAGTAPAEVVVPRSRAPPTAGTAPVVVVVPRGRVPAAGGTATAAVAISPPRSSSRRRRCSCCRPRRRR